MTLKVIGAGFGRTGTDSMRKALNILGIGPTHHMLELSDGSPKRGLWLDMVDGAEPDWDLLFAGYGSCVDWPSAHYWRVLADVYPEAKILLTMRSAESWWESFERTILQFIRRGDDPKGFAQNLIGEQVFGGRPDDKDHAIRIYNENIEEVLETVPPERLLAHNLGDGWQPLYDWLGAPVPDEEYPGGNTTEDFTERNFQS